MSLSVKEVDRMLISFTESNLKCLNRCKKAVENQNARLAGLIDRLVTQTHISNTDLARVKMERLKLEAVQLKWNLVRISMQPTLEILGEAFQIS